MNQPQKRRLGRGLAALIGDDTSEESLIEDARHLRHIPIELITASANNPRKTFAEDDLNDLSKSISDKGLLQPLVVRPAKQANHYEIVAGERRWRAAQKAGIHDVPVLIRELSDSEALEVALIENIQRSDLNPIEEARGFEKLTKEYEYTQQQLANAIGKSRSHIANTLRLLTLPEQVQTKIETGALSAGHARTLITANSPDEVAQKIISLGLNVREAEGLAKKTTLADVEKKKAAKTALTQKPADIRALERTITEATGMKVDIICAQGERGKLSLHFQRLEQLDRLCRLLTKS